MKPLRPFVDRLGMLGLAIVFAWALWYVVREELNESQRRPMQVVFETDAGLDADPAKRRQVVTVEVQGARRAVDAFRTMQAPQVVRHVALKSIPPGQDETRLDFGKEDLDFAELLGGNALTVVEMNPPVVSIRVFRVEVQEKTVAPPEFQGANDLSLRHVLQGYTNTAKVRGAVSVLSTFREIRTFVSKEHLQGYADSLRDTPKIAVRLTLDVDPAQRDLFTLVEPQELSARVELSRVAEQDLVVPIHIFDESPRAGKAARRVQFAELNKPWFVRGDPPKVRLQVTGVPSALAALAASKVRAFVLAGDLAEDQRNGDVPVHVADLPPGVALSEDYGLYVEETR